MLYILRFIIKFLFITKNLHPKNILKNKKPMSKLTTTLNKEVSKRDFLKMIGGFLAFFSFGGFTALVTSKLTGSETKTISYGSRPYGM